MENYQSIPLYKVRSFGEKINVTFSFIRVNAADFFKAHVRITGIALIIAAIVNVVIVQNAMGDTSGLNTGTYTGSTEGLLNNLLSNLVNLIYGAVAALVTLGFLKRKSNNESTDALDIWFEIRPLLLNAIFFMILYGLAVIFGFILLVLPGIFLAVKLALGLPSLVMERSNALDAMDRSYKLTKGNWWSLFGLVLVIALILAVVSFVILLPIGALFGFASYFSLQGGEGFLSLSVWQIAVASVLQLAVNAVTYSFMWLGLAFHYGSEVEMNESRSLMEDINAMDRDDGQSRNDGEY